LVRAIHGYHDVHGKLPPSVVRDKGGKPLYSWRVALLPFLEEGPLYKRFTLDEPWDSPHNKTLAVHTPWCYSGPWPNEDDGTTHYQVFVGPRTAFERDGLTFADFPGGWSHTLFVVEAAAPVPWSKPADLEYDPDGPLPALGAGTTVPARFICWTVAAHPVVAVGMGDGAVQFLRTPVEEDILRGLITRSRGENFKVP
jgi:hypothetical protein